MISQSQLGLVAVLKANVARLLDSLPSKREAPVIAQGTQFEVEEVLAQRPPAPPLPPCKPLSQAEASEAATLAQLRGALYPSEA